MPWDFWLIFAVLGVILPWRGRARLQKLLAEPRLSGRDRLALYASTIAFQWLLTLVAAWRAHSRGLSWADLGLLHLGRAQNLIAATVGAAALASLQWLNLRRMGRTKGRAPALMRQLAERIFPQSRKELALYLLLSLTAGLCEEFLYRGFVMAALAQVGLPAWTVVLLSSILFGLAHLYQGRGGFVSTLVIGTVFGTARIAYDALVPEMAWHTAFDAVAGLVGPRYLLRAEESAGAAEAHSIAEK
ncbi:MAG TPA: CPBP family intramembrane glutamic endopeptidase [Candidatus Acidoferrum sp.]|nr:CPBP family intramembrane glutamic endopeptidase [Candidatus Acidoferrum sp.]